MTKRRSAPIFMKPAARDASDATRRSIIGSYLAERARRRRTARYRKGYKPPNNHPVKYQVQRLQGRDWHPCGGLFVSFAKAQGLQRRILEQRPKIDLRIAAVQEASQ